MTTASFMTFATGNKVSRKLAKESPTLARLKMLAKEADEGRSVDTTGMSKDEFLKALARKS